MKTKILKAMVLGLISTPLMAAQISCETPRGSKQFTIKKSGSVSMKSPFESKGREIASSAAVRTRFQGKGFTKILFVDGEKYILHIDNKNEFSSLDDYLVIRGKSGHEMTYPLDCQKS